MVLFRKINMDLFLFLPLLLCIPLIETENTDCNGKSFHCANSTHFMICVDVGGGVLMTINNFVLPCPPTTFCLETNSFECEYRTPTTQKSIFQKSEVPNELIVINTTTIAYGNTVPEIDSSKTENTFVLPLQKYYSIATTNKILADNTINTIPYTRLRLVLKNETVNKNENEDNINNKLKPEMAINLNNIYKSKSQSLDPKLESEQVVNVFVDADAKTKLTQDSFTTKVFPSEIDGKFLSAVTTLNSVGYNSEHFTQNKFTIDVTQNSTTNNLINATENYLNNTVKNNTSITVEMVNETTEIINTFLNNTQNDNFSDTKFISNLYVTNDSLKEPNTIAFLSNNFFNDMEFSNNATNDEINVQLNMVSDKVDLFKSTENDYGTTENIRSLTQINSYITTVKIKQSENVTNELYQDPISIATTDETLTATNAKGFQENSMNPYPDHIKINSTPTTEICSQNGNITCFVNDVSFNTINESTKIITVDTTLKSLEGTRDIATASLLNIDKDYFRLYDETSSTILMNSTDSTNLLQTFTNPYSENKLYDIIPTTLPNYPINTTTIKSFDQQTNVSSKIENFEVDTEPRLINNSLTTEIISVVQVFSGFESAPTTFKSQDYFITDNVKHNISNINIAKNTSTNYLKIGTSKKVSQDKTKISKTVTEVLDKTIKKMNTRISNKLPNNKEYGVTDKMLISDNYILNDSLIVPNMTSESYNISSSDVKINNILLLNNTSRSEEYNKQPHKDSENIENLPKKRFRLLEQTNNDDITPKSAKFETFTTTLYPDKILVTTAPNTITTTYFKNRFQDEFVTNYPKFEYITTSSILVSKLSIQNNSVVFAKNNNSLRYVNKNITTYYTSPSTPESTKDISTPNILTTDKDIFTLNNESQSTVVVNSTNSSYKLDSPAKFKNYDSLIEMDSISQNYTINPTTKKGPNENFTSNNNLLNVNVDMKGNNVTIYNVTSNGSSSNVVENQVIFTDIGELKANNLLNHTILDPTNKFYDMANSKYTKANININLQGVTRPPINITTPNSDTKFRDLQNATFISIVNNNDFNNKFVDNSKLIFLENNFSDYNQTYVNNTTFVDEYELVDNVIANNSVTKEPKENLTIKEFENQKVLINNVIQQSVHLTHEKFINDFREYKPINQQMNSEIVTETTDNVLEHYTHSTLDMYKYFRTNYDTGDVITLNKKEANTRSSFDTSTLTNENKQVNILTNIKEERSKEIFKSTTDTAIRISHTTSGSLSEKKNILNEKNNALKINNTDSANQKMVPFKMKQLINIDNLSIDITSNRKIDEIVNDSFNTIETTLETPSFEKIDKLIKTYDSNKNTSYLDENFINSTIDLIKSEIRPKSRSTNILQNDIHEILESIISNKTVPYINPPNVYNETRTVPLQAMVIETQRKHLLSVNTTIDKTYFSTDATNDENVYENETLVVNMGQEEFTTNKKIDQNYEIVLNSTITNFTEVSSILNSNNNKSNQYILSQTKELEHTATTLIPNALYKISNNNTEIIRENISKQLDSDSLNNRSLTGLHQSKIPVNNITDIRSSIQKEHKFLKSTTLFHDFLLVTTEINQLKGLTTSAGTDIETMQNREKRIEVTTNFLQKVDTENFTPLINVLNNKEIIQNFTNDYSRTESSILFNKVEDFLSNKTIKNSTTDSSINTDMEIDIRTGNKSNEPKVPTNDIKQVININVNGSWNQAVYDNNNKSNNFSDVGTINNDSLKLPSNHNGIRHDEKKNITNINSIKDLFLLQSSLGSSTEMPNLLNFSARLENNETRKQPNVGREIRLQGSGKINITAYSGSSIYKYELMKNKNTSKFVTTNYSNTTTNSQITYHNNNIYAYKAVDASISDMRKSSFYCKNNFRGKFGDKDNCKKFYICIGNSIAVVGLCPINTVFSDFSKQCTNNLSHCVRNYQFQCTSEGRFGDVMHENIYYICIKGLNHNFIRFKFKCQNGYTLDKKNMICKITEKMLNSSSSSSSSSSDTLKNKKLDNYVSNKKQNFKCEREGKFVDPFNSRRYYICSKTSQLILRRRRKKCDSDEVFDDDKNMCVDKDSYEYS